MNDKKTGLKQKAVMMAHFRAIALDELRLSQRDPAHQLENTWLCVPQLISNLACLTSASPPGPKVVMNLIGDDLRQWENALHLAAKPGIFTVARRIMVHPKFTKSYAYDTFVTLNSIGVEMKIFDGPAEIVQWIQKNLKITTGFQIGKESANRELIIAKSNQRCPIFAWSSHYQIAFKSGIFESEVVFTASGHPDSKGEEMYARFHNEKPKMRYCSAGRSGILEVPTNSSSIFLYFITDMERSITGPQLLDMIKDVQKSSLDAEPLFTHGGFGDLAMEDAEVLFDLLGMKNSH
ncbi:unnamed protein product [Angiostrongylus costaricensis]|uniref:START domain-containing protein n=1 Tax=Angiostrongylus costaricensis TaxID=334426 RepID=A0A158PH92_ANGCS|nr:unnamed protein product [Angiostrongylus costaricensis]